MAKYSVQIKEVLQRTVLVEAESLCDAEEKVEAAYDNEEIVLDYKDYVGASFSGKEIDSDDYETLAEAGVEIISK